MQQSPLDEQRIRNRDTRIAWRQFWRRCETLHLWRTMDAGRHGWAWLYDVTGNISSEDKNSGQKSR